MFKFYRTDDKLIHELDTLQGGTWIQMVNPSVAEGQMVADELNVDIEDVLAALDEEESSRIELQDGYTLILVDIPSIETRHDKESYTTIPLGIILTDDEIVTVCTEDTPVLQVFLNNRVKEFSTKKKMRFVYQILYRISVLYQNDLRIIDKMRTGESRRGYRGGRFDRTSRVGIHTRILCHIASCQWSCVRETDQIQAP